MNIKSAAAGLVFFVILPLLPLFPQSSFPVEEQLLQEAAFHENVEVRSAMRELIMAPFYSLLTRQKEIRSQVLSPVSVEFEVRKSEDAFYLLFKNEQDYKYPVWGRGTYIIKRDLRSGDFLQIKVFLQNDENSFVRLYPMDENHSTLELQLYGLGLYDGVVLPLPLEELALSSFARVLSLTRDAVRWDEILANISWPEWRRVAALVSRIRDDLPYLKECKDGAMDENRQFSLISTGQPSGVEGGVNCSGFAKWVADGILLGRGTKELLSFEELKRPVETEGREKNPWSHNREDREPWFGLDWCRNIAVALRQAEPGGLVEKPSELDVKGLPFFEYRKNIGYKLDKLRSLLYLQAVRRPGYIYWGVVNSPFGEDPVLWQYHHAALFFPWFDRQGDFQLVVMETGTETSLDYLEARYPGSFVHLSRVKAPDTYISPFYGDDLDFRGLELFLRD